VPGVASRSVEAAPAAGRFSLVSDMERRDRPDERIREAVDPVVPVPLIHHRSNDDDDTVIDRRRSDNV